MLLKLLNPKMFKVEFEKEQRGPKYSDMTKRKENHSMQRQISSKTIRKRGKATESI